MSFNYWLDNVGYISKKKIKSIIENPESGFTGFKRYSNGVPGAFAFVFYNQKTLKLDVVCLK